MNIVVKEYLVSMWGVTRVLRGCMAWRLEQAPLLRFLVVYWAYAHLLGCKNAEPEGTRRASRADPRTV